MEPPRCLAAFFDLGDTLVRSADRSWLAGAKKALRAAKAAGLRLGIISNTGDLDRAQLSELLPEDFDWGDFEPALVILSSEVGVEKPSPEIFLKAVAASGAGPAECLFCTEDLTDALAAQRAGMIVARVQPPPHSDVGLVMEAATRAGLVPKRRGRRRSRASDSQDPPGTEAVSSETLEPHIAMSRRKKSMSTSYIAEPPESISPQKLAEAVQALAESAQALSGAATRIERAAQLMVQTTEQSRTSGLPQPDGSGAVGDGVAPTATPTTSRINIWEDDPYSEAAPTTDPPLAATIDVATPTNNNALLQTTITDPAPAPNRYAPGTGQFRYWAAAEALARGVNFWAPLLPSGTRWTAFSSPLRVELDAGVDLNAYYSRDQGLRFFGETVLGVAISAADSPDVVCHELGHAILDAIRPQLFDAASLEVDAFHESFGDMSALLCGLQLPSLRQKVLAETSGRLNRNSRLSRLAEQLGWGIRQLAPTAVDPDCLRNAANRFFYMNPTTLPPRAPANQLSSEPHSFSRVFTGAFLSILARMLDVAGGGDEGLRRVGRDMGGLLANGARSASIVPRYFSQVAAAMIEADQTLFSGRYREALRSGFVEHGILSFKAVGELGRAAAPGGPDREALGAPDVRAFGEGVYGDGDDGHTRTAADAPSLPIRAVHAVGGLAIQAHVPNEPQRFAVRSASLVGQPNGESADEDAAAFIEDLIQTGRVETPQNGGGVGRGAAAAMAMIASTPTRGAETTHVLVPTDDGAWLLKRRHFDCGLRGCRRRHGH